MVFESVHQLYEFLSMIYCGVVIGCLYDLFGIVRKILPWRFTVHLLDILFCASSLVVTAVFVYFSTRGILKIYIFTGILIGLLLQFWGIKPIIKAGVNACSRFLLRMRRLSRRKSDAEESKQSSDG